MERRGDNRVGGLAFNKGKDKTYTVKSTVFNAWTILAVKISIQEDKDKDKSIKQAVKDAVSDLHASNFEILCATTIHRLLNLFWFEVDSVDEFHILENLADICLSFCNSVAGDEKLWKCDGTS